LVSRTRYSKWHDTVKLLPQLLPRVETATIYQLQVAENKRATRRNRTGDLLTTNSLQDPTQSNQEQLTPPTDEDSE
jgi:hypothetical protein